MKKNVWYIVLLFNLIGVQTKAQGLLYDVLKEKIEKQEYPYIIIPAGYEALSKRLELGKIKNTDSFSLRLWTGGMFGYSVAIFDKQNGNWIGRKYQYYLDTFIVHEVKLNPKISGSDFIERLKALDLSSFISQYEIKEFKDNVDDGTLYTVEIIVGKEYKVVQYHSPELFSDNDNKKAHTLIKLIKQYFNPL